MDKKRMIVIGLFALVIIGVAFFVGTNFVEQSTVYFDNSQDQQESIMGKALTFNNITLTDHTIYYPNNTCKASNLGMDVYIDPCEARRIGSRDIEQYVEFAWNGDNPQQTSWVFVYEGDLQTAQMNKYNPTLPHQEDKLVKTQTLISNYLVNGIISYEDLGTPDSRCTLGSQYNNSKMYDVFKINQTDFQEVYETYCFNTVNPINSTSFEITGFIDVQEIKEVEVIGTWVDVSNSVEFMGNDLLGHNYSYYSVSNYTFDPNETVKTQWIYTPKDEADQGKWHILGYAGEGIEDLHDAIIEGNYLYNDPSWLSTLGDGLISYYNFDESSGDLIDVVRGKHNGTLGGTIVQNSDGILGTGYEFDGAGEDITITDHADFDFTDAEYTVAIWLNATSQGSHQQIIGKYNTKYTFYNTIQSTNTYYSLYKQTDTTNIVVNAGSVIYGDWIFYVVLVNSTHLCIYVNDARIGCDANDGTIEDAVVDIVIGNSGNQYTGFMDELGIWNRSLSNAEITTLYNGGLGQTFSPASISPTVLLHSPADNFNQTTNDLTFNYSCSDDLLVDNLTLFIDGSENTTTIWGSSDDTGNISTPLTIADGDHTWKVRCYDNETQVTTSNTRKFGIDGISPNISLGNVTDLSTLILPINSTINISVEDAHIGSCWYYTNDNSTNTTKTCNAYFDIVWTTGGAKTIYAYTNDTFGNSNSTSATLNVYDFNYTQTGLATAGEGTSQTFTLLVNSTSFAIGDASANLWYDGNNRGATSKTAIGSNVYYFTTTFPIPTGAGNTTGKDVDWYWNYNATQLTSRNTTTQTQLVYNMSISDCAVLGGKTILTMNLKDEEENTFANTTAPNIANIEVDLEVTSLINLSQTWAFSKQWATNNASVCVPNELLNESSYTIDFVVGYDATDHVREFFYMDNGTLDNSNTFNSYTSSTLNLLDLMSADSTTFLFEYTDEDNQEVDNIVVHTFRKYIGEGLFREVERSKQDNAGQTHNHLVEEDVIYYFMITQYGIILFTSDTYNAKCLSTPCEITLSASATEQNWSVIDNEGGKYIITVDKATRTVTTAFTLDTISTVNASVYRFFNGNTTIINSSVLTATAGSIDIVIPLVYDNSTFFVAIFKDGTFIKSQWVSLMESAKDYFGTLGAILGGLIILTMMLMAVSEGAGFIVFTTLALIVVGVMQLVDLSWLAIISIICAGGIIVFKLINRRGSKQ